MAASKTKVKIKSSAASETPHALPDALLTHLPDQILSLPGLQDLDTVEFAGYVPVREQTTPSTSSDSTPSLFYWFVGAVDYENRPTILWTNGGPGSSSFWGFFLENGPYIIDAEGTTLTKRPDAWHHYANYMIFEHPLSVTLSFGEDADVPKTVEEGIDQLYQALLNFMELHPEIARSPLVLAGESYAGTYLPLLAKAIQAGNADGKTPLKLKGMVLMDAWVNPMVQMAQDTNYAFSHGLISEAQKRHLDESCSGPTYLPQINDAIQKLSGCYMANIAQTQDPSFDPIYKYLNRPDVRKALHVENQTPLTQNWSATVSANYTPHLNDSYAPVVQELLDSGQLKVQVISGLNDAKDCNFLGTGAWLDLLQGPAAATFQAAAQRPWKGRGESVLGFDRDGGLLRWLKVLNAGHMAAMDQPQLIDYILEAFD